MARSNKPIIWGLFAAGGTLAAFVVPVLILISFLGVPLGLISPAALSYGNLLGMLQHPLSKFIAFGTLFLIIWHAAHRTRITAHDLGIRSDTLVAFICYGIATTGTAIALVALLSL